MGRNSKMQLRDATSQRGALRSCCVACDGCGRECARLHAQVSKFNALGFLVPDSEGPPCSESPSSPYGGKERPHCGLALSKFKPPMDDVCDTV